LKSYTLHVGAPGFTRISNNEFREGESISDRAVKRPDSMSKISCWEFSGNIRWPLQRLSMREAMAKLRFRSTGSDKLKKNIASSSKELAQGLKSGVKKQTIHVEKSC